MKNRKKIIIFGAGGHHKVILSELKKLNDFNVLAIIGKEGNIVKSDAPENETYSLQELDKLSSLIDSNTYGIVAVGFNYLRQKIVDDVSKNLKNLKWATIISKDSIVSPDVSIDEGSVVVSGSIVNTHTKIGKHCIINTGSCIEHENIFDDYVSCGPKVTTGGNVKIKSSSFIGMRSVIQHKISIGKNTVIGANSFVNSDCGDNMIYYGNPAEFIRKRENDENYLKGNKV